MNKNFFGDFDEDDYVDGEDTAVDEVSLSLLQQRYDEIMSVSDANERLRLAMALVAEMSE
jgi:hypothetical protein